jgi:hypothetical protein
MEPLTDAQIDVMERVRGRLRTRGFALTDAELITYAVLYRRLRKEWSEWGRQEKPHPIEIFVLFGQEEGFGE